MVGKIFITRSGYDPEQGHKVKDPYLGEKPSMGACRPDIRKRLSIGDHIFTISGKVVGYSQFVMGGFEIEEKIDAQEALRRFPEQKLTRDLGGQLLGNIIVDGRGYQHTLDTHNPKTFDDRIRNYVVGTNPVVLAEPREIAIGRVETLDRLRGILKKPGKTPFEVVGHYGSSLTESQVLDIRAWLADLKRRAITQ